MKQSSLSVPAAYPKGVDTFLRIVLGFPLMSGSHRPESSCKNAQVDLTKSGSKQED